MAWLGIIIIIYLHGYVVSGSIFSASLYPRIEENNWSELESHPGPLASQATALTTRRWLLSQPSMWKLQSQWSGALNSLQEQSLTCISHPDSFAGKEPGRSRRRSFPRSCQPRSSERRHLRVFRISSLFPSEASRRCEGCSGCWASTAATRLTSDFPRLKLDCWKCVLLKWLFYATYKYLHWQCWLQEKYWTEAGIEMKMEFSQQ